MMTQPIPKLWAGLRKKSKFPKIFVPLNSPKTRLKPPLLKAASASKTWRVKIFDFDRAAAHDLTTSWREENCFAGGYATEAHLPNPPASLVAVPGGGFGLGLPYLLCRGGGGVRPQHTWLKMIPTSR